jgi:hypothetical protein
LEAARLLGPVINLQLQDAAGVSLQSPALLHLRHVKLLAWPVRGIVHAQQLAIFFSGKKLLAGLIQKSTGRRNLCVAYRHGHCTLLCSLTRIIPSTIMLMLRSCYINFTFLLMFFAFGCASCACFAVH